MLVVSLFIFWIYLLTVLVRAKLHFFKFLIGAVGLFFFMIIFFQKFAVMLLTLWVTVVSGLIGDAVGYFKSFSDYGLIFINTNNCNISMYIDYECSGVIEIFAYMALLWFFPLYNTLEKIMYTVIGALWIFAANILRIVIICSIVHYYGDSTFYFAHTIFGRLIFYILSIILYFHVFTKSHIKRQKVGNVSYEYTTK
ncbi:transmembrane exosortase EpsH [Clostridium acetobutylicum]|nr:transmembrane exosortase EpsH [Clostridium acetobutylicum]OOM08230.1 transmembrane exosortase EpsH [Clostridium acetobutylicum]